MKKLALFLCLFTFACSAKHARKTEVYAKGRELQINKSADDVLSIAVQTLMNDGFMPKTINKEFGFVTFEPKSMSTAEFYKTVGIPEKTISSLMKLAISHTEEIHLNCTTKAVDDETSLLKLKTQVFSFYVKSYTCFSGRSPDAGTSRHYEHSYSGYAADYYFEKILNALGMRTQTTK